MTYVILSIGKWKKSPHQDLFSFYQNRLLSPCQLIELEAKTSFPPQILPEKEAELLQKHIPDQAWRIVLDSTGQAISSVDFSQKLDQWQQQGLKKFCFIIGGAYGLAPSILKQADYCLSLGKMTWPHLLTRCMLIEQIYRAEMILKNHPYHH